MQLFGEKEYVYVGMHDQRKTEHRDRERKSKKDRKKQKEKLMKVRNQ